jgi:hypothetical protein
MWRSIKVGQILACCYVLMCEKSKAEKEVNVVTYKMHSQQVYKILLVSCHSLIGRKWKKKQHFCPPTVNEILFCSRRVFLHLQWITVILQWLNFHRHQLLQHDDQKHPLIHSVNHLPCSQCSLIFITLLIDLLKKSGCVS